MSRATECFSMYSDMSMRMSAVSSSNRNSASALVSSVLPTPFGPKNMNEPIGLADHEFPALLLHAQEFFLFALEHAIDRDAGPTRDHLRDVIGGDGLLDHRAFALPRFHRLQPLLDLRDAAIGDFAGALILGAALR